NEFGRHSHLLRSSPGISSCQAAAPPSNRMNPRRLMGLSVTCFYLDRFRAHALGHEAFEIGADGSIFGGHCIPARVRPSCRVRGLAGAQGLMERPLNRVERLCLRFRHVAREITQESLLAQASFIAIEYSL